MHGKDSAKRLEDEPEPEVMMVEGEKSGESEAGLLTDFLSECRLGWNLEYVTVILTLTLTDTDTTSSISLSIQSIYPTTCNSGWWW